MPRTRAHKASACLVAMVTTSGCGYHTLGAGRVSVTLDGVLAVDPDPTFVALARATVREAFAREGILEGGVIHVEVSARALIPSAPASGFASEARAEVSLRAHISEGGRGRWIETRGEAEAPAGQDAMSAQEALRLARRRACEQAAQRLAEALRSALD